MDDATETGTVGFWTRMRRRKVVQWGIAYVAGAWALLQGIGFLADAFHWHDAAKQIATLILLIGLPIVLVLAWYHGDRGERRIRGTELAIITLLFIVGGGIFWLYDRGSEDDSARVQAQAAAFTASARVAAPASDAKSIAVLPFADMSPGKDQGYMSDGLAEELLNRLAQAPDLKVIARTSSFAFKGERIEIAEVARRLNVAHVLEGSVRTSGNKIRVTAQLIRAADGIHLWSQTYDRPLDDIFAVQDEIAGAIVQALQIKLMGGELNRRRGGTQNLEAYQLYLRANDEGWNSRESLDRVETLLNQAIALDPDFSMAWSGLSRVYLLRGMSRYLDTTSAFERARELANRALQLSPDNAIAVGRLPLISLIDWDWKAAEVESRRALALDPLCSSVCVNAAKVNMTLGHWDEAERLLRATLTRDPLNAFALSSLALTYYRSRRFEEAEATLRQLLTMPEVFPWIRGYLGLTLLEKGQPDAALEIAQQEVDQAFRLIVLPILLQATGRKAEADSALQSLIKQRSDSGAVWIAGNYAYRGENNLALEWLERAYRQRDPAFAEMYGEPLFDGLADDPRFKAFLRKMKLPEWPRQAIAATGT